MPAHPAVVTPPPMTMPLIPAWSITPWVAAMVAVAALHVWHAGSAPRHERWWHMGHVAMSAGMVVMFLVPHHDHGRLYWIFTVVFGLLAAAMGAGALLLRHATGAERGIWVAAMGDQLAMVYMVIPLAARPAGLTALVVAYLVAAAAVWVAGRAWLTRVRRAAATAGWTPGVRAGPGSAPTFGPTVGVRLSLAAMAVAMAWMLLAMQAMEGPAAHGHHHGGASVLAGGAPLDVEPR